MNAGTSWNIKFTVLIIVCLPREEYVPWVWKRASVVQTNKLKNWEKSVLLTSVVAEVCKRLKDRERISGRDWVF